MASNIEIKARVHDRERLERAARSLADSEELLFQEDTFFNAPSGRLKLRRFSEDHGELIQYVRPDQAGPKQSDYFISRTGDPDGLKIVLEKALGVFGIVRKQRRLLMVGQTRIHIDAVENLGDFMELEVVLRAGQDAADGEAIACDLMEKLGVSKDDLIDGAYIDLLRDGAESPE